MQRSIVYRKPRAIRLPDTPSLTCTAPVLRKEPRSQPLFALRSGRSRAWALAETSTDAQKSAALSPQLRNFATVELCDGQNLVPKGQRSAQSHDIAKRVRPAIQQIAARYKARIKVSETPPGPPVLQTLVAEVYGPNYQRQIEVARQIEDILDKTEGVVDVDSFIEDPQVKYHFV